MSLFEVESWFAGVDYTESDNDNEEDDDEDYTEDEQEDDDDDEDEFDKRTIYQLHILGITTIVERQLKR